MPMSDAETLAQMEIQDKRPLGNYQVPAVSTISQAICRDFAGIPGCDLLVATSSLKSAAWRENPG